MGKNKKNSKSIMDEDIDYNYAVESFLDSLEKKESWQNLEKKLNEYKNKGWEDSKLKKAYQWERKAYDMYTEAHEKSMTSIKIVAHGLTIEEFQKLELWIRTSKNSKKACNRSSIGLNDPLNIIKARLIHLVYMAKAAKPVNIGALIAKQE